MPQRADERGVLGGVPLAMPMTVGQYQKAICEEWFASTSSFVASALLSPVSFPTHFPDSIGARGILLANNFGLVLSCNKCPKCNGAATLLSRPRVDRPFPRFTWECTSGGHKHDHLQEAVRGVGLFAKLPITSWAPMMHFILMLRRSDRYTSIVSEMQTAYGITNHHTLNHWRVLYQSDLKTCVEAENALVIGGSGETVVFDETLLGVHKGVQSGTKRTRSSSRSRPVVRKRILRRLPGKTVWRARATRPRLTMRRRSSSIVGTRNDPRHNGRWLWMAVSVGKGKQLFTHANGLKRVSFAMLQRAEHAPNRKPRGLKAMKAVIASRIKKKSFLIFDGWKSSEAAVRQLGYRHAPPVNHTLGWRDTATGFHSNDIESENSRLKNFLRNRYSKLLIQETRCVAAAEDSTEVKDIEVLDLFEYAYYTNIGDTMSKVMHGVAAAGGGSAKSFRV